MTRFRFVSAVLLLLAFCPAPMLPAANRTYTGGDGGNWSTGFNWSGSVGPALGDMVFLGSASAVTANVTLNLNVDLTSNQLQLLVIDSSMISGVFTLSQTIASSVMFASEERIGTTVGGNVYNQSAGLNRTNLLTVGLGAGASFGSGIYNLSGTGTLNTTDLRINPFGLSNAGQFNQTGGTANISQLLSIGGISSGSYNLSAGALNLTNTNSLVGATLTIGGGGAMNHTAGIVQFSGSGGGLNVGTSAGNVITSYTLNGSAQLKGANVEIIGQSFAGTFLHKGGTNTLAAGGTLTIGGAGLYDFSGGTLTAPALTVVGLYKQTGGTLTATGTGVTVSAGGTFTLDSTTSAAAVNASSLTLSGGAFAQSGGSITLSSFLISNGAFTLNGGSVGVGSNFFVGSGGTGTFTANGGTITANAGLLLGSGSGSSGTLTLGGTNLTVSGFEVVGSFGTGIVNQTSGTHQANGLVTIGSSFGGVGTYNLSGGTFSFGPAGGLILGNSGSGTLNFSGGSLVVPALSLQIGANGGVGLLQITGGAFSVSGATLGDATVASGTISVTNGAAAVFTGLVLFNSSTTGLNLNGGALSVQAIGTGGSARPTFALSDPATGPALTFNGAAQFSNIVADFTDAALGAGTVRVTNSAVLAINGGILTNTGGWTADNGGSIQFLGGSLRPGVGSLTAGTGGTITYNNGVAVQGGSLFGPGTQSIGAGGASFTGTTSYAPLTQTGPAVLRSFTNAGAFTNNGLLTWNGGRNDDAGVMTINAVANLSNVSSRGVLTVNSGGVINNTVSSLVFGGGSRTTINSGGVLNALGGTTVELNGGLLTNNGTITGTLNVNYGGTARGAGIFGTVNVGDGGKFSPGSGPITVNALNLAATGAYRFELADAALAAAAPALVNAGPLAFAAPGSPDARFRFELASVTAASAPGLTLGFDPARAQDFVIARNLGGITGFDVAAVLVDTSAFLNATQGGAFTVGVLGNDLVLHFQPVPEPGVNAGLAAGTVLAALASFRRRRNRRGTEVSR